METSRRPRKTSPPHVSSEGSWRPSMGYLVIAVIVAASGLGYWWFSSASSNDAIAAAAPSAEKREASASGMSAWPVLASVFSLHNTADAQEPKADRDPTPDLSDYVPKGANPSMKEVIERLHKEGIHTGLGAFNPPGTNPPKIGIAVPDDFQLPEGYVRHHQVTDDGQRIEPILMFAPDKQILDANNRPVEIPEDRVVPPELAPPGLPIRRIEIPPPLDAGRSAP